MPESPDYTPGPWPDDGPLFDEHAQHPAATEPIDVDEADDGHRNTCPDGWEPHQVDDALDAAFDEAHYEATSDGELAAQVTESEGGDQ